MLYHTFGLMGQLVVVIPELSRIRLELQTVGFDHQMAVHATSCLFWLGFLVLCHPYPISWILRNHRP